MERRQPDDPAAAQHRRRPDRGRRASSLPRRSSSTRRTWPAPPAGFADHRPAVNFVDPWPGGWWRLRDIVDYELICARSLLTLAARYRRSSSRTCGDGPRRDRKGKDEPPFAWLVPADQRDPGRPSRWSASFTRRGSRSSVPPRRFRSRASPIRPGPGSCPPRSPIAPT